MCWTFRDFTSQTRTIPSLPAPATNCALLLNVAQYTSAYSDNKSDEGINQQNYTHTHTFNGPLSTRVNQYQKGKTNLDFTEATDSEWQWHQLSHMQVCTSLQTDNHASTLPLSFLQAGCPSCSPTNVKALKVAINKSKQSIKTINWSEESLHKQHGHPSIRSQLTADRKIYSFISHGCFPSVI